MLNHDNAPIPTETEIKLFKSAAIFLGSLIED